MAASGSGRRAPWPTPSRRGRRARRAWAEGTEGAGAGQRGRGAPGSQRGEGEGGAHDARDGEAAARLEGVAGDEGAVARVEESDVAGSVAGGGDDGERADAIARASRRVGRVVQVGQPPRSLACDSAGSRLRSPARKRASRAGTRIQQWR